MFSLRCFALARNDKWTQQKETHHFFATFVEHVIRVRQVEKVSRAVLSDGAAAAEGIGDSYISKRPLLRLGLSASAGFSLEGRESPSLCMGTNKTRWFSFFSRYDSLFTVWVKTLVGNACVFDIKEKAKTKSLSWWLKEKQPSEQSHCYHKKNEIHTGQKGVCRKRKKTKHLVIQHIRCAQ